MMGVNADFVVRYTLSVMSQLSIYFKNLWMHLDEWIYWVDPESLWINKTYNIENALYVGYLAQPQSWEERLGVNQATRSLKQ